MKSLLIRSRLLLQIPITTHDGVAPAGHRGRLAIGLLLMTNANNRWPDRLVCSSQQLGD